MQRVRLFRSLLQMSLGLALLLAAGPLPARASAGLSPSAASACQVSSGTGILFGQVSLPGGTPLEDAEVTLYLADGREIGRRETDAAGGYYFGDLAPGAYLVHARAPHGNVYAAEWYSNRTDAAQADAVNVYNGLSAIVNLELPLGAQLQGKVMGSDGVALEGVEVEVYDAYWETAAYGVTDANGLYTTSPGLPTGVYIVGFFPDYDAPYFEAYYPDGADWEYAQPITVTAPNAVTNLNATLQRGGQITGRTVHAQTGDPVLAYVTLEGTYSTFGQSTDASGYYTMTALPSGTYRVSFEPQYAQANLYAPPRIVEVTVANTTAGVDAAFEPGGQIMGHVTYAGGGASNAYVEAWSPDNGYLQYAKVSATGAYTFSSLAPGPYQVYFRENGYGAEWYNNRQTRAQSDPVWVTAGGVVAGIDAVLDAAGSISGTVTAADSNLPLAGVRVTAYLASGEGIATVTTDAQGRYWLDGLPAGEYRLWFEPHDYSVSCGYIPEWYNDQTSQPAGDLVTVTSANTTANINAVLAPGSVLQGQVTAADTGVPIPYAWITVYDQAENEVAYAQTNILGRFITEPALPTGQYRLHFADPEIGYVDEFYTDAQTLAAAQPVNVTAPTDVTGLDAALTRGGFITGRVTAGGTDQPLAGVGVTVYDAAGRPVGYGGTEWNGNYIVPSGLATGSYRLRFAAYQDALVIYGSAAAFGPPETPDQAARSVRGPQALGALALAPAAPQAALASLKASYLPPFYNRKPSLDSADYVPVVAPNTTTGIDVVSMYGVFLPLTQR